MTPIFIDEIERLAGWRPDPYDVDQCRRAIVIWLNHYVPRVDARTREQIYELYRRGAAGYRRWKRRIKEEEDAHGCERPRP